VHLFLCQGKGRLLSRSIGAGRSGEVPGDITRVGRAGELRKWEPNSMALPRPAVALIDHTYQGKIGHYF